MAKETKQEKEAGALAPRKPAAALTRWQDVDRWFDRMVEEFWRRPFPSLLHPERFLPLRAAFMRMPSLDVYEEKDDVVVRADLPGMTKDEIEVNLLGDTLTIKGERKKEEDVKEEQYTYRERTYGAFVRSIALPTEVKADQVKASFKDGVLEIRLPKTQEARKKAISVKIE